MDMWDSKIQLLYSIFKLQSLPMHKLPQEIVTGNTLQLIGAAANAAECGDRIEKFWWHKLSDREDYSTHRFGHTPMWWQRSCERRLFMGRVEFIGGRRRWLLHPKQTHPSNPFLQPLRIEPHLQRWIHLNPLDKNWMDRKDIACLQAHEEMDNKSTSHMELDRRCQSVVTWTEQLSPWRWRGINATKYVRSNAEAIIFVAG